jgi:Rrf2 family iron-sulfur cluster assembly transcriptional regulator
MHLSSQEEYGLRCLVQLARHEGEAPLRIQDIAEAEGLSAEYVAKLMRILRQGDLVSSTRGASGGYRLARLPEDISLWEAVSVLGGPLFPDGFCESHPGALRDCVHSTGCSIRALWRSVSELLRHALSGVTVKDLQRPESEAFTWLNLGGLAGGEPASSCGSEGTTVASTGAGTETLRARGVPR